MLYILIIIVGAIASYFGPWWIIALVSMALCWYKADNAKQAFITASLAAITLWLSYGIFLNASADVSMVDKIADLFTGGVGILSYIPKSVFVFGIMSAIAGFVGGLGGVTGVQLRNYFK